MCESVGVCRSDCVSSDCGHEQTTQDTSKSEPHIIMSK